MEDGGWGMGDGFELWVGICVSHIYFGHIYFGFPVDTRSLSGCPSYKGGTGDKSREATAR